MKQLHIGIFSLALVFFMNARAQQTDSSATQAKKEIDAFIAEFYSILSYKNSKPDGVDSLPNLFVTDGTLTAVFGLRPMLWTASQFAAFIKNGARQGITGRTETEIAEHTAIFGNMAHRFSTYKLTAMVNGKEEEERGINSIQLIRQNGRWLIHSLVRDRERAGLKLPKTHGGE